MGRVLARERGRCHRYRRHRKNRHPPQIRFHRFPPSPEILLLIAARRSCWNNRKAYGVPFTLCTQDTGIQRVFG
jgi:hypothetical protein